MLWQSRAQELQFCVLGVLLRRWQDGVADVRLHGRRPLRRVRCGRCVHQRHRHVRADQEVLHPRLLQEQLRRPERDCHERRRVGRLRAELHLYADAGCALEESLGHACHARQHPDRPEEHHQRPVHLQGAEPDRLPVRPPVLRALPRRELHRDGGGLLRPAAVGGRNQHPGHRRGGGAGLAEPQRHERGCDDDRRRSRGRGHSDDGRARHGLLLLLHDRHRLPGPGPPLHRLLHLVYPRRHLLHWHLLGRRNVCSLWPVFGSQPHGLRQDLHGGRLDVRHVVRHERRERGLQQRGDGRGCERLHIPRPPDPHPERQALPALGHAGRPPQLHLDASGLPQRRPRGELLPEPHERVHDLVRDLRRLQALGDLLPDRRPAAGLRPGLRGQQRDHARGPEVRRVRRLDPLRPLGARLPDPAEENPARDQPQQGCGDLHHAESDDPRCAHRPDHRWSKLDHGVVLLRLLPHLTGPAGLHPLRGGGRLRDLPGDLRVQRQVAAGLPLA
mmetsp:Transcript_9079/g.26934  ORF Transcript_9079/g.26934 Transcript_9079/m.26934 type:complete len:502 (-) Transcript_9079:922-2427(-)